MGTQDLARSRETGAPTGSLPSRKAATISPLCPPPARVQGTSHSLQECEVLSWL